MELVSLSIVGSWGFDDDLFELAVVYWYENDEFHLTYSTDITDDVLGYLSNKNVMDTLREIKKLYVKGD